jgi:hypothetical protein
MNTTVATDYLPVDLLGIGGAPLFLIYVAIAAVIVGFVASGLMLRFKVGVIKSIAVLVFLLGAAASSAWIAYGDYHQIATDNLAANLTNKYPALTLQEPEKVIDRYLALKSENNQPLEVTVAHEGKALVYRLDESKGLPEPVLAPAGNNDAPNPIEFTRSGEAK